MDHLPVPSDPVHAAFVVPLRCVPSGIGQSFEIGNFRPSFTTYPAHRGWDTEALLTGHFDGHTLEEAESFLQEWLFFGLLGEVLNSCGSTIIESFDDFISTAVEEGSSKQVINTSHLPKYIEKWQQEAAASGEEARRLAFTRANDILAEARVYVGKLTLMAASYDVRLPMDDAILLSIVVLGETLEFSKMNIFKKVTAGQSAPMSYWGNRHILGHLLRSDSHHFCQNQIRMLEATVSAATMYYAYRSDLLRDDDKDHSECTEERCTANYIDPKTYKTLHTVPTCTCDHIESTMDEAKSILAEGLEDDSNAFPIISVASPLSTYDDLDVKIVPASADVTFIAISHVWSDGLGNPTTNSLPQCQLRDLRYKVGGVLWDKGAKNGSRIHFWIDTLCVPLEEPLRGRAIELIKTTFEAASEVLVLDSKLKRLPRSAPYTENLMRITCTGWLRRLWTFLEGVLAKKLSFQFADGATEVRVWMHDRYKDHSTNLWNLTPVDAEQFYWLVRHLNRYDSSQRVARIWNALQWRSTSRTSDENICVASLFGLELSEIMRTPVELRMKKLLEMQGQFPLGVIFMFGVRMEDKGLGWAPISFMEMRENEYGLLNAESDPAYASDDGLYVNYSGFLLALQRRPLSDTLFLLDMSNSSAYLVQWQQEPHKKPWPWFGPENVQRTAIITSRNLAHEPESVGILVNIDHEEDDCLYVETNSRVIVRREPGEAYSQHLDAFQGESEAILDEYLYAAGIMLPSDQQWCVG